MPVTYREPPPAATEAVQAALDHFAGVPQAQLHALAGTQPAALAPTVPHPVYNVGLSDLVGGGAALPEGRPTGWRYLLRQDDAVVASAETASGSGGEQFSHFNRGPFVASTAAALEQVDGLTQTQGRPYEVRLLHVPALHAVSLWLHDDGDPGNDLLIPLQPAPPGVEAQRPYAANDLLAILRDQAAAIPEMGPDDTRGG